MKILACILSFYVLALSAISCIDRSDVHELQKSAFSAQNNSGHQHSEGDECSPFCACNCCSSPIIYTDFNVKFDKNTIVKKSVSEDYTSEIYSFYLSSIWQPPQLA
jgi:hypothetical protein